jgi:hypothetical protein
MRIQNLFTGRLFYVALTLCSILFFELSCGKAEEYSRNCLTCTAKYNSGAVAATREACGDEEQRAFKSEFSHADIVECH